MTLLRILGHIVVVASWIAASVLGLYIYVFSILGAYHGSGTAAIVTAALPPFAQIYWLIYNWVMSGTITSPYSLACLAWIAAVAIIVVVGRAISD